MANFEVPEDFGKIVAATVLPMAGWSALGYLCLSGAGEFENIKSWWKSLKKPWWAPSNPSVSTTINSLTIAPVGTAAYLVYKHGGGSGDSTTVAALSLYGTISAIGFVSAPYMMKPRFYRNLKLMFYSNVYHLAVYTSLTALFYKVYPKAGLMLMPLVLWITYGLAVMYNIRQHNDDSPKDV